MTEKDKIPLCELSHEQVLEIAAMYHAALVAISANTSADSVSGSIARRTLVEGEEVKKWKNQ